ncbi:hypothetical protein DRN93_02880 [archaeon]|nr:MAG: hypothetical protein DRN93_02880 [archaeon]HDN18121.1 hypothetical protein [Candidatus Bathyarchaeota archaeon]
MNIEEYKRSHIFGMDYGTSMFKYGPITLGEYPEIVENRGYFIDRKSIVYRLMGVDRDIVVGEELPTYLESKEDLSKLIYPMKNGVVERGDVRAWRVVEEITRYGLQNFPLPEDEMGYFLVASISAVSPRYMYERIFDIFRKIDGGWIHSATIIPQPLAVAISHKIPTCTVIESGHGNTQICPISRYPIRGAIFALNRGGSDANSLMAEILKDAGYGDLAQEENLVRRVKEEVGLIPRNLDEAIEFAKGNPEKVRAEVKIPDTRIRIVLEEEAWTRFLPGEYIFNPNHEIFESYFRRGMSRPRNLRIGNVTFEGMKSLGDAVAESIERCPVEIQPNLYKNILLSGGNFSWKAPEGLKPYAVDAVEKMSIQLSEFGIEGIQVFMSSSPQFSVWRGCVLYGYAVPADYEWSWEIMEGWMKIGT